MKKSYVLIGRYVLAGGLVLVAGACNNAGSSLRDADSTAVIPARDSAGVSGLAKTDMGGSQAPVEPRDSAAGILQVLP